MIILAPISFYSTILKNLNLNWNKIGHQEAQYCDNTLSNTIVSKDNYLKNRLRDISQ